MQTSKCPFSLFKSVYGETSIIQPTLTSLWRLRPQLSCFSRWTSKVSRRDFFTIKLWRPSCESSNRAFIFNNAFDAQSVSAVKRYIPQISCDYQHWHFNPIFTLVGSYHIINGTMCFEFVVSHLAHHDTMLPVLVATICTKWRKLARIQVWGLIESIRVLQSLHK